MPNKERGLEHTKTILQQTGKKTMRIGFVLEKKEADSIDDYCYDNRIVIGCSVCGRDFVIKKNAKGKRPKFCPDCREKRKKLASKKYFDSIKVSGKYTEDKAELLKMFYVMRSYDKKIQKILKEAVHIENRPILKAVARILQIFLNRFQKYLGEEQINLIK